MTLIYVITRIITFVGAFFRNLWELLVCRLCNVAVYDSRPFRYSEFCGHAEHESLDKNPWKAFFICWFPFTMNFILGIYFVANSSYQLIYIGNTKNIVAYYFFFFGISFLANCAPSFKDMLDFKNSVYGGKNVFLKIIFAPFFGVFCVMSCLEKYSLTFLMAIALGVTFPYIFSYLFPVLTFFQNLL